MDGSLEDESERGYRYFDWIAGKKQFSTVLSSKNGYRIVCLELSLILASKVARNIKINNKKPYMFTADNLNNDDKTFLN